MSENKFIRHLQGKDTAKSVLEIKNQNTPTSFADMPNGTSNANDVYSDPRGDAVGVLKGSDNWKLDGQNLVEATTVYGDGRDLTTTYQASGATLWVNSTYTFSSAKRFNPNTKFVLKLCGHSLDSDVDAVVNFSLIITFGNTIITKSFRESIYAFNFCKEFVIDFAESNQSAIKVDTNDTMQVQLLCSDATASAVIYNGMTVFTALQRRVDGDAVASDKKTFDEVVDNVEQLQEDLDDLEEYVDETFVKKAGDTMSGALNIANIASSNTPLLTLTHSSTTTYKWNIAPRYNSTTLSIYPGSTETNGYRFATTGFVPASNNARYLGSASLKWKGIYVGVINNGADLTVPNKTGTLATMDDVELAARSGRMLTDQGVWYAKMYAATVAPAAEDGTNYADFSQVDGQGNPIIVTYNRVSGAWVQDQTITPPAEYDGYVPITSKIWDIAEQENQQGGRVMWNHQSKEFTPYPLIVDVSYLIDEIDTKQDKLIAGDNITITRLVPDGYDALEYIESDGTQYINTLVPVNISNSFDVDCVLLSGNSDAHLISEGNVSIRVGANAFTWYTQAAHYLSTFTPGDNYNIQCGLNYLMVNGNTISGTTDSDNVSGTSVYLLARNTAVSQCKARIKHVKIYDANSDLAFDGTPAIRNADGVVGLYDSVSETFFANSDAGASNFIAGNKIASTVISSTADPLPDQTGHAGGFLSTDGTDASWQAINASGYHPDLFDWKWADHQVNDIQWLRADTFSWQSGSVYPAAYKHLRNDMYNWYSWANNGTTIYTKKAYPEVGEKVYSDSALTTEVGEITDVTDTLDITVEKITVNGVVYDSVSGSNIAPTTETVGGVTVQYIPAEDGHKIVTDFHESEVADVYTATGVAWYYIIDYGFKRFKLPRTKWGVTGYRDGVGNYVDAGLPNITGSAIVCGQNDTAIKVKSYTGAFKEVGTGSVYNNYDSSSQTTTYGIALDASDASSVYGASTTVQPRANQMYLYFYVGEFTQTALENTAGLNAGLFNGKADTDLGNVLANIDFVIESQLPTAGNNYTWYRKYKSGWIEQGGYANTSGNTGAQITLPVTMSDAHYQILLTCNDNATGGGYHTIIYSNQTTTGFETSPAYQGEWRTGAFYWLVNGMAA